jgi:aspartate 1-decarboxylase
MKLTLMRAKIHHATITHADLNYEGSISINKSLLLASKILVNEKVDVLNLNNGERFTTYVILGEDNNTIQINGAAARKVQVGDKIIIIAYGSMDYEEAQKFQPNVVIADAKNQPLRIV